MLRIIEHEDGRERRERQQRQEQALLNEARARDLQDAEDARAQRDFELSQKREGLVEVTGDAAEPTRTTARAPKGKGF